MGFNKIKENTGKFILNTAFFAAAVCCMFLDKMYVQADLILENPNTEYSKGEDVTTALDIIVIVIITVLVVLAVIGICRMRKKARQDELDDETRMVQNKKEQDL